MYVHYYGYSCIRYISYEFLGLSEACQESAVVQFVYCFSTCFRIHVLFGSRRVDPEMGHTEILTDHA